MPESEQQEGNQKNWLLDVFSKAIQFVTKIATVAMKDATPFQKRVIFVCYGIIVAGIFTITVPPYLAWKEILALVFIVVPLLVVLFLPRKVQPPPPVGPSLDPWHPLPNLKFEKLRTLLEDTREEACAFLKSWKSELSDDDVRANIFYPEYDSSGESDKYVLKIYQGLHFKMELGPELQITFKPGQGATGKVFASGQACVAQRLPSDTGGWDDTFNINDALAKKIHPNLKWVISMPLRIAGGKPMAVVNVDGLRCQFLNDVLYKCMGTLTLNVVAMSDAIASS